jgi:formate hydrogenlyase transcriptional activator
MAEQALEDTGQAFAEAVPDGILIAAADGRIVFANQQLAALAGYEPDGLVGLPLETLLPERYREVHLEHRAAFAAEPRTRPMGSGLDTVLRCRDGSELPVDIALRPSQPNGVGQVVAAVRDASQRKQLEQALWHSEQRLRLLLEAVTDYAISMLDPAGRVVSWNQGAERIKGWRREEILGEHLSRFYPREDVEAGKPARELQVAARDGRVEDEGWRLRKDGSRFWANVVITAIHDHAGVLHGFAKVTRDLGEQRLLEAQERRLALLAERERIAKGLFEQIVQALFAVGLGLQAATFADDATLRARIDAAVQDLDEVIVDLRSHVFQLRAE